MAGFLSPLRIEEIPGDDQHWRLLEPCIYHLGEPDGQEWVEVPVGFVTDFGSIPRLFWNLPDLSPFGKFRRGYVVHDKLYIAPVIRTLTSARATTRAEADAILREALQVLGASWATRHLIYCGVRVGGWVAWRRYRAAEQDV